MYVMTWVTECLTVFQGGSCGRNLVPFQYHDILSEFIQFLSGGNMRRLEGIIVNCPYDNISTPLSCGSKDIHIDGSDGLFNTCM